MGVQLTQDAEKERLQNKPQPKNTWELLRDTSMVRILHEAKNLGWKEKKVQVRFERVGKDIVEYVVEPYEKGCRCRNLLKFEDFFLPTLKSPQEPESED